MLRYASTAEAPVRPKRLRFGLLSAREIERMSVCKVTETMLYYRGLPATGGLLDPLMGTVDRRHLCATCMNDTRTCQGHPGHIALAFPVYHIGFVDAVVKVLRVACFCCARVCAPDADAEGVVAGVPARARLAALCNALRTRKACPHCHFPRPSVTRTSLGIKVVWADDAAFADDAERAFCTAGAFTARDALSILRNLSDADVARMGFSPHESHPQNMIVQNVVVPPPCTRPAIYSSEGSRSRGQNDLTVRLLEILKRSHEVAAYLGEEHTWHTLPAATPELLERLNRLQYEVYMLVNNSARVVKPAGMGRNSSNASCKSINERLKGKEGRVRGNLMGKRVDFSARCVITPDAWFDCDRVGVPYRIAMTLTYPEVVNATNIQQLSDRVRVGASTVHGAQNVIHRDGTVTNLQTCRDRTAVFLRPGDVVERFLADDDVVVFNRQPSLHMHGMQAHRVRLMPGHTFRLSLVVAAPYNADFDGDEMNLHVPQSAAAVAECATLMGVAQNALGAQSNRPVMGIVQDSLLGLFLLSRQEVLVDHAHVCRILGHARAAGAYGALPPPAVRAWAADGAVRRLWTGKQVFSAIVPRGIYVEHDKQLRDRAPADAAAWADDDLPVTVLDGQLVCGVLRKAHVGTGAGGIVDTICRERDGVACMRFMGDAQRITHEFLLQRGHHVGIHDVMISAEGHAQVLERLDKATLLCEEIQREMTSGTQDEQRTGEAAIMRLLSKTLLQTGGIVNEHLAASNAIRRMVSAGSKGSFINLSQICAALGQQSLEGGRITLAKDARTLPCFAHQDDSLASRGMVQNSFSLGLNPPELFFHAVGGREGLVDTAVKTSQSGYISRRMNKSMEDNVLREDGVVANSLGDVIAFRWGSDGFHPARVERVRLDELGEPEAALRARMAPDEADAVLAAVRAIRAVKRHVLTGDSDDRVLLPYHTGRLRREMARHAGSCDPAEVMARVRAELLGADAPLVVVASVLGLLNTHTVAALPRAYAHALVTRLAHRLAHARCTMFESAGCLAAQSISERGTQLTLNSFHTSGVAAKNVTLGIPRFKELLDATRHPKTPCTTLRFHPPLAAAPRFAAFFAATIPLTRLADVVHSCAITDDSDPRRTVFPEDQWMVDADAVLGCDAHAHSARMVVRLELAQEVMRARHLTPPMVRRVLAERLGARALVTSSETASVEWVVRVRFHFVGEMVAQGALDADHEAVLCHRALNVLLDTVVISGHPNVTAASAGEDEDGSAVVHAYGNLLTDCAASAAVDWTRTTSNDVWEVYHALGVEAAACVLFEQIKSVVAFDGTYVDDRHILLIVDSICRGGSIMPLNRHGINKAEHAAPLMRCSFEETMDVLCEAAGYAQSENARGVSTCIMTGQLANMGTGAARALFPVHAPPSVAHAGTRRAVRSTCRSYTQRADAEVLEYVSDDRVRPVRPLSPPSVDERNATRKRARFRVVSPQRDE